MCGIVGAVAQRDIADILVEGLRRLEYRGYDSAGVAIISPQGELQRVRRLGKVQELASALDAQPLAGGIGIAHTRWATHGEPSEINAHPHVSNGDLAVVHNGIIENHEELRVKLQGLGYEFVSQTDTEVIVHLVHHYLKSSDSLLQALQKAVKELRGAYGTVVMDRRDPSRLVVARSGSPLVIGRGLGENFIASDQLALLPVTRRFMFLEEGDVAEVTRKEVKIFNQAGQPVECAEIESDLSHDAGDKGHYRHYMQKEIFEQPQALINTLEGRITHDSVIVDSIGVHATEILSKVQHVQIVACGTSYNSGMAARYWFEAIGGVSCDVEIASEFRYRKFVTRPNSLLITLSQSGETADTLAALRLAKEKGYMAAMTICNVAGSSLVRESDIAFMTRAGTEIGVASTKAFTTQLLALFSLAVTLAKQRQRLDEATETRYLDALRHLPGSVQHALNLEPQITLWAEQFAKRHHALFLGRGVHYPIALEGALKLKEITYIHAEAYPAGELKHGPLALVDEDMPVVVIAPNDSLLEKVKSNMQEVRARGGELFVFADLDSHFHDSEGVHVIRTPRHVGVLSPVVHAIPVQLLAYHAALARGTDVDKPRNLAKSVTVE